MRIKSKYLQVYNVVGVTEYNGKKLSDYKTAPYDSDGYPLVYFKHSGTGHYAMTWGNEYNI